MFTYQYCEALRNIPEDKVKVIKEDIISKCSVCSNGVICDRCTVKLKIYDRYIMSNIPIDFWGFDMKNFEGDKRVLSIYESIVKDVREYYVSGKSLLLVGAHGVGKTTASCCLLKFVATKGYGALYATMGDIVNVMIHGTNQVRFEARRELMMVSFLVIDEFDSRFIGSDSAAELFGRVLESILRIRLHNHMPTILISNNLNPTKALGDYLGPSINSLINGYVNKIAVIGPDFREKLKSSGRNL